MSTETGASFRQTLHRAIADGKNGRAELLRRLSTCPIDEIAQLPPTTLALLGPQGLLALARKRHDLADLAPHPIPTSTNPATPTALPRRGRHPLARALPLTTAILILGLAADLARPAINAEWLDPGSRPHSTETWPLCSRLDPWVDGCVYMTGSDNLTLNRAAAWLDMPAANLAAINTQLQANTASPLPADSFIVVWRGILQLEGTHP